MTEQGEQTAQAPRFDLPEADAFTRPYWDAAASGRLLIRRCRSCTKAHHYPREFCPHCWSEDVEWEEASGRASLYTWSVVHRNDLPPFGGRVPYVAAVVDLAEGPRMMTAIVDCTEDDLRIGGELRLATDATSERSTDRSTDRPTDKSTDESTDRPTDAFPDMFTAPVFRPVSSLD